MQNKNRLYRQDAEFCNDEAYVICIYNWALE